MKLAHVASPGADSAICGARLGADSLAFDWCSIDDDACTTIDGHPACPACTRASDYSRRDGVDAPDLFAMAQDLHASRWGSADPLHPVDEREYLAVIRARLAHWSGSEGAPWHAYDEAARALLTVVLAEYDGEVKPHSPLRTTPIRA